MGLRRKEKGEAYNIHKDLSGRSKRKQIKAAERIKEFNKEFEGDSQLRGDVARTLTENIRNAVGKGDHDVAHTMISALNKMKLDKDTFKQVESTLMDMSAHEDGRLSFTATTKLLEHAKKGHVDYGDVKIPIKQIIQHRRGNEYVISNVVDILSHITPNEREHLQNTLEFMEKERDKIKPEESDMSHRQLTSNISRLRNKLEKMEQN